MQCMLQNILKEVIFWALLASGDFHNNEVQRPRKALLADAWSEILAGLSELGLTVLTSLCATPQLHSQPSPDSLLNLGDPDPPPDLI